MQQGDSVQNTVVVLVVEDDQLVQGLVKDALADGGFEAEITSSGEDAVRLLQDNVRKYSALITDVNLLGELTGWEVGHSARELNPDIPVIYMTGAAADEWSANGVPKSILLNKPFAPAQIVAAVAQLLNEGSISPGRN
jgi:DNA-binding response OmpR family regulator